MANTTRQNSLLVNQDWTRVYESFRNADFQSYDYQTLRKSMIEYLQLYYPEDFNDFIESSEFIALIDMIAYLGQSLAFRTDLNARENFIDTAERRESVLKLAKLISYAPKRNKAAQGFLKFESIRTTEPLRDNEGNDLTNLSIFWNDNTNVNWYEQFIIVVNAALISGQKVGRPSNTQTIGGIVNSEYNINTPSDILPVFAFDSEIEGTPLPFEFVSATSVNKSYIYEVSPRLGQVFNILYRNDGQGNASNNTGFFLYFKQGVLNSTNFSIIESIPNNVININADNINNDDVWLFERNANNVLTNEWNQVLAVQAPNIIYNSNAAKKSYQVTTKTSDQIDLIFGDGTFASIPQGNFTAFYRQSSGTTYKIVPSEMQNISLNIPYVSATGRPETLTITASLKYTVANALAAETTDEIRARAPQQYYTQNRMVTAEDYNTFPYANFSSISKIKAVNRTSSGTSRFLDTADTTGRYSSTNIFNEDGILIKEDVIDNSITFSFSTTVDINKVIQNQILPKIKAKELLHFYYKYFNRFTLDNLYWEQVTVGSSSGTGYFKNSAGLPQQIGSLVTGSNKYIGVNCIVIFSPGTGNYFNAQNKIMPLPSSGIIPDGGKDTIYATVTNVIGNGEQGILNTGLGPISVSEIIPTDAIAQTVIPAYNNTFSTEFTQSLIREISNYSEFGLRFDQTEGAWKIIPKSYLNTDVDSQGNYIFSQTREGLGEDNSWLLNFTLTSTVYTVEIRGLRYRFDSLRATKFYYDETTKIFDPITGRTVNDTVKVLQVNKNPQGTALLNHDVNWWVRGQVIDSDGFVNNSKVYVSYSDKNDDGVPDDPDIFDMVVGDDLVFFERDTSDISFINYLALDPGEVNTDYAISSDILPDINLYVVGQLFFTTSTEDVTGRKFYQITLNSSGIRELLDVTLDENNFYQYKFYSGRRDLYFQYRHNALNSRRIDPSPSNLIDLYILTKGYETDYRVWATNVSNNLIQEPSRPTSEELKLQFSTLEDYKSVSDALIFNSAKFKPLFGPRASSELQATFKVVKNTGINLSDSEIRTQVLKYINNFFASGNWDFGDTFYFTELATYIQQSMAPNVSSIIIVPKSSDQIYGSLQQISSEANEILISVATIDNIEIISGITSTKLGTSSSTLNTIIT
jgi:hypothetical protein